jgi:peptidoglycan/LPS O-acetylase OafA/YrhL
MSVQHVSPSATVATPVVNPADGQSPSPGAVRTRDRAARVLAVAALATTSAVHAPVTIEHLHEIPYLGYTFAALVLLTGAAAGSLLVESRTPVWVAVILLCGGALVAYVVSRTVGLPQADDDIGDWANPLGLVAGAAELVVVVVAGLVLLRRRQH